ncbi:hypothetical protein BGZ72_002718 [Mortierella alpina]|nr:hypothetical protein BGZ72_002718 [Mortierella alpina]
MHGSVLFLALATVALGATARLNSEGSASAMASKDRMNSPSLAARDLLNLNVAGTNAHKPIVVNIGGSSATGDSNLPILDIANDASTINILGGKTGLLKKRNGSFLGLRRRNDVNVPGTNVDLDKAASDLVGLNHNSGLLGAGSNVLKGVGDEISSLDTKSGNDLLNTKSGTGLLGSLGLKRRLDLGAVAQVDLSGQNPTVTVDLNGLLDGTHTGAPCVEGLAAEAVNTDTVLDAVTDAGQTDVVDVVNNTIDTNNITDNVDITQPTVANTGNIVDAVVNTQQPAATENGNGAAAVVNTDQAAPAVNPANVDTSTNDPLAAVSNEDPLVDAAVDTTNGSLLDAKVNTDSGSLVDVDVNTGRTPVVDTNSGSLLDVEVNTDSGSLLAVKVDTNSDKLLTATVDNGKIADVTLKRRLYKMSEGYKQEANQLRKRSNRDDDDDDDDEDEDEDEDEEEVKGSTVKDNKPKDGKETHPVDTNNDKKEAPKDDPEKHKNSASSGSTANKIALLGALVGTVFMLA